MKPNNFISKKWAIPAVGVGLVLLAAVLLWRGLPQSQDPGAQVGAPPSTGQPQTVQTAPAEPTQTAPPGTEPGTEPSLPAETQTEPDEPPAQSQPSGGSSDASPPGQEEPEEIASGDLTCDEFARFSGQFVEDGRDELVENVAAILVTNRSGQYLDLATLSYDIDGTAATFVVTGLPAGASAWVMEADRLVIGDDAVFTYLDCITAFRQEVTVITDDVSIYADANMLTAVNNTDETLEDVFVCYKTVHTDGNFFGGITYRVDFGTLEPGGSAQVLAGHYSYDTTQIVRIGWVGQ